ncbi:MAG: hypothetical protein GY938_31795 [Ketobacter sp.]|nr:hypothetical protein [Ketobacter sp.]
MTNSSSLLILATVICSNGVDLTETVCIFVVARETNRAVVRADIINVTPSCIKGMSHALIIGAIEPVVGGARAAGERILPVSAVRNTIGHQVVLEAKVSGGGLGVIEVAGSTCRAVEPVVGVDSAHHTVCSGAYGHAVGIVRAASDGYQGEPTVTEIAFGSRGVDVTIVDGSDVTDVLIEVEAIVAFLASQNQSLKLVTYAVGDVCLHAVTLDGMVAGLASQARGVEVVHQRAVVLRRARQKAV